MATHLSADPKTASNRRILLEIADCVAASPSGNRSESNIGLLDGKAGEAMFLMYYARYSRKNKYYEAALNKIDQVFDIINAGDYTPTHCSGIAGVCWTIEHLVAHNFIDADLEDSLGEFDAFLAETMHREMESANFDFMHGALGIAFYLLRRRLSRPSLDQHLEKFVDDLFNCAVADDPDTLKWIVTNNNETGEKGPNISLSHGSASIVSMLAKFIRQGIAVEKSVNMLNRAVEYILRQENNPAQKGSCFPSYSLETQRGHYSLLGWCYGDVGIGLALLRAGQATGQQLWCDKAIAVLLHSCTRRNIQTNEINDAGFCHGAGGLAYIYLRLFFETGNPTFYDTSSYWYQITRDFAIHPDGFAGYKTHSTPQADGWHYRSDLLNGITGIGFSLLQTLVDMPYNWDECLLIS